MWAASLWSKHHADDSDHLEEETTDTGPSQRARRLAGRRPHRLTWQAPALASRSAFQGGAETQ